MPNSNLTTKISKIQESLKSIHNEIEELEKELIKPKHNPIGTTYQFSKLTISDETMKNINGTALKILLFLNNNVNESGKITIQEQVLANSIGASIRSIFRSKKELLSSGLIKYTKYSIGADGGWVGTYELLGINNEFDSKK